MLPNLHLIRLQNTSILEQLRLEEALLRTDEKNFCLMNFGSKKTIVMGISGQIEQLIDIEKARAQRIEILKRFSGGGTVIVDQNTLFISLLIAKKDLHIAPFPEPILQWTAGLYASAWNIPNFHLRENDYCIGEKKCGGNAQYIRKERWLHHTSFLWDFDPATMEMLFLPSKRPMYRKDRPHNAFLTRLKEYGCTPEVRLAQMEEVLAKHFSIVPFVPNLHCTPPHRQTTEVLLI